jgi:hypothetical protein
LILNIGAKPLFIVVNSKVNKVAMFGSFGSIAPAKRSAAERYQTEILQVRTYCRFGSAPVKCFSLFLGICDSLALRCGCRMQVHRPHKTDPRRRHRPHTHASRVVLVSFSSHKPHRPIAEERAKGLIIANKLRPPPPDCIITLCCACL